MHKAHRALVLNIRQEKADVYIGRGSKWGNPFRIGSDGDRAQVVRAYAEWLHQPEQSELLGQVQELRGKTLGCYCAPLACHGWVLAELANRPEQAALAHEHDEEHQDGADRPDCTWCKKEAYAGGPHGCGCCCTYCLA